MRIDYLQTKSRSYLSRWNVCSAPRNPLWVLWRFMSCAEAQSRMKSQFACGPIHFQIFTTQRYASRLPNRFMTSLLAYSSRLLKDQNLVRLVIFFLPPFSSNMRHFEWFPWQVYISHLIRSSSTIVQFQWHVSFSATMDRIEYESFRLASTLPCFPFYIGCRDFLATPFSSFLMV